MSARIPIIPTILVVAAAATMVGLGVWQLGRADEKTALIAEFETQAASSEIIDIERGDAQYVYRTVRFTCGAPTDWQAIAGRSDRGQSGLAHRYLCDALEFSDGPTRRTYVDIGWSTIPKDPLFQGGAVEGVLVRMGDDFKLIVTEPQTADLQPLAKPDPNDLPNNHLAYAGQWFFFALTALVIYFFALRSRMAKRD